MNFDEIYKNISSFWETISPIFFAHIVALIAVRWIAGFRWHILSSAESALSTDRYKRWKTVLDEFDLRPKLPFVAVIGILIYLVLFNSLLINPVSSLTPISVAYSETEFWEGNRPLDELAEIAAYGSN